MELLAWTCAGLGLVLGGVGALVPGFPGCAVALLGLVAFAGLTDLRTVGPGALVLAACVVVIGSFGQLAGPVAGGRAAGGTAGAATGAALGAAAGAFVPLPGAAWGGAVVGAALLGLVASRGELVGWVRGVVGTAGGCLVGVLADLVAVLAIGAILGFADFLAAV
ncbi:MAG: DUF456 family protein [Alphaproteobacteria bacterium]|nr:DUF456 family protein [Alphaproteobacteria bacterium]MCB9694982.1 DUF456 family protein [Alphaproteobacteria bacterium]MCB9696337.1 DUF456 family protein [Alphaproteobacteria bacterium]